MKHKKTEALTGKGVTSAYPGKAFFILSLIFGAIALALGFSALLAPLAKVIVIALAAAALILIVVFTVGLALFAKDGAASRLMAFIESASENGLDLRISHVCLCLLPAFCVLGLLSVLIAFLTARKRSVALSSLRRVLLITLSAVMGILLLLSILFLVL